MSETSPATTSALVCTKCGMHVAQLTFMPGKPDSCGVTQLRGYCDVCRDWCGPRLVDCPFCKGKGKVPA